jgi:formylglycine-generating enzyme required for sulfatase activity
VRACPTRILLGVAALLAACTGQPPTVPADDIEAVEAATDQVQADPSPAPSQEPPPPSDGPTPAPAPPPVRPPGTRWCDPIEGSTLPMVLLPPGTFEMGCSDDGADCLENEWPRHQVTRTVPICIGWTEVTRAQWRARLSDDPSVHPDSGMDRPVENMLFHEALAFANAESEAADLRPCYRLTGCEAAPGAGMRCSGVSVRSSTGSVLDCEGFRLPTEAEWEHAAGGGADTVFAGSDSLAEVAWTLDDGTGRPPPVGQKAPNPLGLYDMTGSVWEWTWDCWQYRYPPGPRTDPEGPDCEGGYPHGPRSDSECPDCRGERSSRGGGWTDDASVQRITARSGDPLWHGDDNLGIRLVRSVPTRTTAAKAPAMPTFVASPGPLARGCPDPYDPACVAGYLRLADLLRPGVGDWAALEKETVESLLASERDPPDAASSSGSSPPSPAEFASGLVRRLALDTLLGGGEVQVDLSEHPVPAGAPWRHLELTLQHPRLGAVDAAVRLPAEGDRVPLVLVLPGHLASESFVDDAWTGLGGERLVAGGLGLVMAQPRGADAEDVEGKAAVRLLSAGHSLVAVHAAEAWLIAGAIDHLRDGGRLPAGRTGLLGHSSGAFSGNVLCHLAAGVSDPPIAACVTDAEGAYFKLLHPPDGLWVLDETDPRLRGLADQLARPPAGFPWLSPRPSYGLDDDGDVERVLAFFRSRLR